MRIEIKNNTDSAIKYYCNFCRQTTDGAPNLNPLNDGVNGFDVAAGEASTCAMQCSDAYNYQMVKLWRSHKSFQDEADAALLFDFEDLENNYV